jgi:hypothetical protein
MNFFHLFAQAACSFVAQPNIFPFHCVSAFFCVRDFYRIILPHETRHHCSPNSPNMYKFPPISILTPV